MSHGGILAAAWLALSMAFAMGWEILRAQVLGFALSGAVQAVVTKGEIGRLLPDSGGPSRPQADWVPLPLPVPMPRWR